MSMTRLFFSFEGRMSRQPYWLATTVVTVVMFVVTAILYNVVDECVKIGTFVLLLALFIPFFWTTLALSTNGCTTATSRHGGYSPSIYCP